MVLREHNDMCKCPWTESVGNIHMILRCGTSTLAVGIWCDASGERWLLHGWQFLTVVVDMCTPHNVFIRVVCQLVSSCCVHAFMLCNITS